MRTLSRSVKLSSIPSIAISATESNELSVHHDKKRLQPEYHRVFLICNTPPYVEKRPRHPSDFSFFGMSMVPDVTPGGFPNHGVLASNKWQQYSFGLLDRNIPQIPILPVTTIAAPVSIGCRCNS